MNCIDEETSGILIRLSGDMVIHLSACYIRVPRDA